MGRASKRYRTNNLRKRNAPDDMFLTYGSFLPQDNAEVVYLNSEEEIQEWEGKDDVKYVERGELVNGPTYMNMLETAFYCYH